VYEKDLSANTLATVLILDTALEQTIEPFRLQPNVTLIVTFEEYLKFCKTEIGNSFDWLATPTADLHYYIREFDRQATTPIFIKLFSSYLRDVALGQIKELSIAEAVGQGATGIRHSTSRTGVILTDKQIEEHYVNVANSELEKKLLTLASNKGYPLYRVSAQNVKHYKYALVTFMSSVNGMIWSSK